MSDRRRRRGATSDEESEEISSDSDHANDDKSVEKASEKSSCKNKEIETVEPEFHSAEEDNAKETEQNERSEKMVKEVSDNYEGDESQTELIDVDGGGEGIAEPVEVEGEFLDDDLLVYAAEDSDKECNKGEIEPVEQEEKSINEDKESDEKNACAEKEEVHEDKAAMSVDKEVPSLDKQEDNVGKEECPNEANSAGEVCVEKNADVTQEKCANEDDEDYGEEEECDEEEEEGAEGEDEECDDEEDEECVKEEREQGDGEECSPGAADKELDFDEDRRNPQYIPKKGIFYEHDDRNSAESPKEAEADVTRDKKKKKLWLDDDKWGHDRYREDEQIPKSKTELIEAYGYDIRCEDCPPRARRRRRYGRGPTKYEPNWEEEGPGKERTLGMFIKRGTRGSRPRGRFRGGNNSFRGTGRPYNKSESDDSFNRNNNNDGDRPRRGSFAAKPPKEPNYYNNWKSDDLPLNGLSKQLKGENLCGWPSEKVPVSDAFKQRTEITECGWESEEEEPVATHNTKPTKVENLCGWESDEAEPVAQPVKQAKGENLCGWESDDNNNKPITHPVKQTKSENVNRWGNNKTTVAPVIQQTKKENPSGWETDESPVEEVPTPIPMNNKEFPALPTKEIISKPLPVDKPSAFTKRKTTIPDTESLQTNSVRTQTFENSTFSNKPPPQSYEKPPRHEGKGSAYRSATRGGGSYRRQPRGRSSRGGDRYNNNGGGDSYLKPTLGPRLLEKQVNRISSDLDRMNLNNKSDTYDNGSAVYEQKRSMKQTIVPSSKVEDSANRPKRYSFLRPSQPAREEPVYHQLPSAVPPSHPSSYDTGYQASPYASEMVAPVPQPPSSVSPTVINPSQYAVFSPPHYPENYVMPMNRLQLVPTRQPIMTQPCMATNANVIQFPPSTNYPPPQLPYQQYTTPSPQASTPVDWTECHEDLGTTYYTQSRYVMDPLS